MTTPGSVHAAIALGITCVVLGLVGTVVMIKREIDHAVRYGELREEMLTQRFEQLRQDVIRTVGVHRKQITELEYVATGLTMLAIDHGHKIKQVSNASEAVLTFHEGRLKKLERRR